MRAAIYCRVSSTQQAKEGDSISAQLDALRKYIRKYSYECVGEFVDDGISGTKYDRDEFQKMLDMVEDAEFRPEVHKAVAARRPCQSHDPFHIRPHFQEALESLCLVGFE